jgi:integrase
MTQINFTEKSVRKLVAPDPAGQKLYWDTALPGFGVLCSGTSDVKTYVVRSSVRGRSIRKTIERVGLIPLQEARRRAKEMMVAFHGGIDPRNARSSNITLREAMELYLNLRQDLRPRSREEYRAVVERHLSSWLDRPLRAIDRTMVEQRHRAIAEEVEQRHRTATAEAARRHLARAERVESHWPEAAERHRARWQAASERKSYSGYATANAAMRALRATWNFLAERPGSDLPPNPVKLKKQWLPVTPRDRHLRADDLPKFYKAVKQLANPVAADYVLLMLFTGLRRREAASLRWNDVDFRGRTLHVPMTKSGRPLKLPTADFVHDMLVARRSIGDTNWVFPADGSESGHIESPKFYFAQIAEATGIYVSAHDLRRTFLTVSESCDISPFALRALVNHSLGRDTTSNYIQMAAERLREPAQRIANKMKELCKVNEPRGKNISRIR